MGDLGGRAPRRPSPRLRLLTHRVRVVVLVVAVYPHLGRGPPRRGRAGRGRGSRSSPSWTGPAGGGGVGQVDGPVLQSAGAHHRRLGKIARRHGPHSWRARASDGKAAAAHDTASRMLMTSAGRAWRPGTSAPSRRRAVPGRRHLGTGRRRGQHPDHGTGLTSPRRTRREPGPPRPPRLHGRAAASPAAAKTTVSSYRAASAVIVTAPGHRCRDRGTRSRGAAGPAGSARATGRCRAASPGPARRPNKCGRPGHRRAGRR